MNMPQSTRQMSSATESKPTRLFLWNVLVAATGIVLGALVLDLPRYVCRFITQQFVPRNAIMMVLGPCPAGWERDSAADLRFLIAADGNAVLPGSIGYDSSTKGRSQSAPLLEPDRNNRVSTPDLAKSSSLGTSAGGGIPYVAVTLCRIE
jgi:hypothetical protein